MIIQEMFDKPIERDIKGVIKVGQADEENIKQELEEYVVTRELRTHFRDFFSNYKRGLSGPTDKMGVWIAGFFGSGKSHFLKILSYLIENKEVDGKKAIDYFIDDQKIDDPMVLADMKLAGRVPTDVILFNIDSKSESSGKHDKDAITSVFLKVFNEMQGYCGAIPALADLERQLDHQNKYEVFQSTFKSLTGKSWLDSRNKFDFIQDAVIDALVEIGFMGEDSARNWCEKAMQQTYQISIESFAQLVNDYLDKKGQDHRLVFLVDEMGQYIGEDSKLMLNLQTVTENLGIASLGRVWVIVTSQQDIDTVTKTKGNEFSKIQGRFDTRLSLSSANVDEVIKKRILEKTPTAAQTLRLLYENRSTIIKNLLIFEGTVEKKLYADKDDFAIVYPFVPYQFDLLASVLTSIRTHGASGKHLSEGERSMLALFKESAMKLMDQKHGALIPFNIFYDALHQFLDHSHKGVITKAIDNRFINPDREDENFNVNVLKTLFLIKYVKEISATVENITSLMIPHVDTDRISLKKQVEKALDILARQTLVQKNGDVYVFLTNEEQEINREIEKIGVEMAEVIAKTSELIFDDLFNESIYNYSKYKGRYRFSFNQIVDDRHLKTKQNHDVGVHVLTPSYENRENEITLRMMSKQDKEVLVVLPNDSTFLDELRGSLKIEKYLRLNTASNQIAKFNQIREAKRQELAIRKSNARLFLNEALKNADIYVNGDKTKVASDAISSRINEALGKLVSTVYHKLSYIDTPMDKEHLLQLFKPTSQISVSIQGEEEANPLALQDVLNFISENTRIHEKTSMKRLVDHFIKAPYGFVKEDVHWLAGKLFKNGDLSFSVSGEVVTLINRKGSEISEYLTKKEYSEKLLIERRQRASEVEKKAVRDIINHLYGIFNIQEDDDSMMQTFKTNTNNRLAELEKLEVHYESHKFPGKRVVKQGKDLLRPLVHIQFPTEFFEKMLDEKDGLIEFSENYEPVKAFFGGEQRKIFQDGLELSAIYDESKNYIVDRQVESAAREIRAILDKEVPYGEIPKLPDLLSKFRKAYTMVLLDMQKPVLQAIADARSRVLDELEKKPYREEYKDRYSIRFKDLEEKAKTCNNVAKLNSFEHEADVLKIRLLEEMSYRDHQVEDKPSDPTSVPPTTPVTFRSISIKQINPSSTWRIESEAVLDQYLQELRERILQELTEDSVINLEF